MPWRRIALAAIALLAVCALGFLRTWPPLATVMSASMAPTINTGDMVVLKKLSGPPHVGDVVTVSVPAEARNRFGYPPVVIHRIVRIDADGVVTTKGDAYEKVDPFDVPSSALSTKVVATVPAAGRVFAFLGSTLGLLWLAGGALLLVGMPGLDRFRDAQRRGLDERDDVRSALQSVTEELTLLRANRVREREQLLEQFTVQIERAVAAAVAAVVPPPPPPPPPPPLPRGPLGCVPASQWKPPTPDMMAILRPVKGPSEIFRLPVDFVAACSS
jgi:signal peptidase I